MQGSASTCSGWLAATQAHLPAGPSGHGLERGVLALPIEEVPAAVHVAITVHLGPDHDDAVGLVVGQRGQQRSVNDAEDGGVGANAEREGENGDRREAGIFPEQTQAEKEVAPAISHWFSSRPRN